MVGMTKWRGRSTRHLGRAQRRKQESTEGRLPFTQGLAHIYMYTYIPSNAAIRSISQFPFVTAHNLTPRPFNICNNSTAPGKSNASTSCLCLLMR